MATEDSIHFLPPLQTTFQPLVTSDQLSVTSTNQSINTSVSGGEDGANLTVPVVQSALVSPASVLPISAPTSETRALDGRDELTGLSGIFTVGKSGKLAIDVLADNGAFNSQIGIFSLTGMANLAVGSVDFAQEAIRRVAAGNQQGYVVFDDATEGSRFDGELGEVNCNQGDYAGIKTVGFQAGEQVALILMPQGTFQQAATSINWDNDQPLFSVSAANFNGQTQLAKLTSNTFGWEDQAYGDRDFNDLVIKVTGATSSLSNLDQVIRSENWEQLEFAQQIRTFVDRPDAILQWNKVALEAIKIDKTAPPAAARNLAIMQTAVFDAVNGMSNFYQSYQVNIAAPAVGAIEAAAVEAAYRTLLELYPNQKAALDDALASSLQSLPTNQSVTDGLAYGQAVAKETLAKRANDGAKVTVAYTTTNEVGAWQPTSTVTEPLLPQWGSVQPFALASGDQFRPSGTPALTSSEYAQQLNQTKELGAINSTSRTADQTEIAKFWADGAGTYTPPGHWNDIAEQVLVQNNGTLIDNARTMALLNIALADAGIACWDSKYIYNTWRPVTAIRNADRDNNPDTIADPNWQPLIATPPFPEYVSGHSTFSGAAATILTTVVGSNTSFSTTTIGLPGVTRSFTSFEQAAAEAGMSRIYGGIHFMEANQDGLALGGQVGNYVLDNVLRAK